MYGGREDVFDKQKQLNGRRGCQAEVSDKTIYLRSNSSCQRKQLSSLFIFVSAFWYSHGQGSGVVPCIGTVTAV